MAIHQMNRRAFATEASPHAHKLEAIRSRRHRHREFPSVLFGQLMFRCRDIERRGGLMGGAGLNNYAFNFYDNNTQAYNVGTANTPINRTVSGFRLVDARASYGFGLETFALGFPVHFDWSYRTLFNKDWEDVVFFGLGGSSEFRKARFAAWIGYDF